MEAELLFQECTGTEWERNLAIAKKRTRFRAWSEKECFEIFSALEYLRWRECENLSGGEMQMVAIARALVGAPGLVLFDEPSQGLAPKIVQDVMRVIRRLKGEGVAVLLVEQNPLAALAVCDRVYVMDKGRIVHQGSAAALAADEALRTRLLGV
jgi:branched-chain amino acid transport system ATP-binding protein